MSVVCPGAWTPRSWTRACRPICRECPPRRSSTRAGDHQIQRGHLYSADALAADVLQGVDRNRAVIIAPRQARIMWRLMRLSPSLLMRLGAAMIARDTGPAGAQRDIGTLSRRA